MIGHNFSIAGAQLIALGSGALWWPDRRLLCVSDLHFGKSERMARRGGALLPPYETQDTLSRLAEDLDRTDAATVVCLGDSFDDLAAAGGLGARETLWLAQMQAGRRWVWIEGNHDPGPVEMGGAHLGVLPEAPLIFRHIAHPGASGEVSGHYHPKATLRTRSATISRPCFLYDSDRLILPAYGTYTGGLACTDPVLSDMMRDEAVAVLTGPTPMPMPMPRRDR